MKVKIFLDNNVKIKDKKWLSNNHLSKQDIKFRKIFVMFFSFFFIEKECRII